MSRRLGVHMIRQTRIVGAALALFGVGAAAFMLFIALIAGATTTAHADTGNDSGSADPAPAAQDSSAANTPGGSADAPGTPKLGDLTDTRPNPSQGDVGPTNSSALGRSDTKRPPSLQESVPNRVTLSLPPMPTNIPTAAEINRTSNAPPLNPQADETSTSDQVGVTPHPSTSAAARLNATTPNRPQLVSIAQKRPDTTISLSTGPLNATLADLDQGANLTRLASNPPTFGANPEMTQPSAAVDDEATTSTPSNAAFASPSLASIATISNPLPTVRPPTLINFVGSIVLNVLGAAVQVFVGPPVLPPGSNVTVRTSSLTLPDIDQTVQADWYFPNDGDPTRLIYFQHGLMANGPMYSYTAAALAEQTGSIVVAPSLSSNFLDPSGQWIGGTPMQHAVADLFAGDRQALSESASSAAGRPVMLPTRFVLIGHSLGGALVTAAAGNMVDNGAIDNLVGVVLLDSVDLNNAIPPALQKLTGVNYRPVQDISSEVYVWNLYGIVGQELEAARPGQFNGVMLAGGRHIDALQGGNPLIQLGEYLVAGFSQPQNIEAVKTIAAGWVNDMFAGTHNGIYGAPQQSIQIPTSAGTATAVVLPFTSTEPIQGTPYDVVSDAILNFLLGMAVYEPLTSTSLF